MMSRQARKDFRSAWTPPPPGTWFGHYPAALFGGVSAGFLSAFIVAPLALVALQLLTSYVGTIEPPAMKMVSLTVVMLAFAFMVAIARATITLLDRRIYRSRQER